MNKQIKPSDLRDFEDVKSEACYRIERPDFYGWYFDKEAKVWFPHRKPTVDEIMNDRFA